MSRWLATYFCETPHCLRVLRYPSNSGLCWWCELWQETVNFGKVKP